MRSVVKNHTKQPTNGMMTWSDLLWCSSAPKVGRKNSQANPQRVTFQKGVMWKRSVRIGRQLERPPRSFTDGKVAVGELDT